ncbi:MAG: molybdopterin oxidoreductase family protein [Rhodospirillaceae bacterium]|nr:molybdopterin oxidoreductase family protein [Rhodospirillaceae bacterium]
MPLDISRTHPAFLPSTCPHDCPSTCSLEVEKLDAHTIGRVRGAEANGYTLGVVCAKVARYKERVHHPARLATPLQRVGDKGGGAAAFRPIGWDDALDIVADKFQRLAAEFGPEAIWPYYYAGTMGLVQRDGLNRLRHAMKYSRQHFTICNALSDAGWRAGHGAKWGADTREMTDSDLIVMWGGNPVHTQVNVMTHVARARKARGAKLFVVDVYKTATCDQADDYILVRPGTDGALASAMMHVMAKEGLADRDYLARYAKDWPDFERHLADKTPEWAAAITGVPAARIAEFARLYGRTERVFLRIGYGFTRARNGAANMHAVTCLPVVGGKWKLRGGGALYGQAGIYRLDNTLIDGLDVLDRKTRLLDQSRIGPVLTGDKRDLGDGPPVKALLVQNTNPMSVAPELLKVREGFRRKDLFVCVHEQFLTETAEMADIVLPATTFLEHADLYIAGGHTHLSVARPVIAPYAEARENHAVVSALAKRLGARHHGFEIDAWGIIDETLKASGLPGADAVADGALAEGKGPWRDYIQPFETQHFLKGFGHADGKFHFKPDWSRIGPAHETMPEFPGFFAAIDAAEPERPFRLVAAPARNYLNSTFTETPTSQARERRPTLLVHPEDCAALAIAEGDRVRIGNARASLVIHAKPFAGVQRGVVVVESIWPNRAFEEGIGINALVSADPGFPNGGAVFHDTAVWVRKAEPRSAAAEAARS